MEGIILSNPSRWTGWPLPVQDLTLLGYPNLQECCDQSNGDPKRFGNSPICGNACVYAYIYIVIYLLFLISRHGYIAMVSNSVCARDLGSKQYLMKMRYPVNSQ